MEKTAANEKSVQPSEDGKYLSFLLGQEEYAVDILKVQEIIGLIPITPVPNVPEYIRGVLNLRGKIVPVMDLRTRFGMRRMDDTGETCVIVAQEEEYLMGIVVDKVSEVIVIKGSEIEEVPSFGISGNSEFLSGIGKVKEQVKMIVDVHKVLFDVPEEVLETRGQPVTGGESERKSGAKNRVSTKQENE